MKLFKYSVPSDDVIQAYKEHRLGEEPETTPSDDSPSRALSEMTEEVTLETLLGSVRRRIIKSVILMVLALSFTVWMVYSGSYILGLALFAIALSRFYYLTDYITFLRHPDKLACNPRRDTSTEIYITVLAVLLILMFVLKHVWGTLQ